MMDDEERRENGFIDFNVDPRDAVFDALRASPYERQQRGIPAEPDRMTEPDLHAFWETLVARPLRYVRPELSSVVGLPRNPSGYFRRTDGAPSVLRYQASRNWSGAYITPRDGRMFTDVIGAWFVPRVTPPGPADGDYRSSTWIGLDGQRQYLQSTLPQIGTAQQVTVVGGVPTYTTSSWVQWWPTIPPKNLLSVDAGDLVACWMTVITYELVFLVIFNLNDLTYSPVLWMAPTIPLPGTSTMVQARVSGATAEWVMERPMVWGSTVLYDLPDYFPGVVATTPRQPVEFTCFARSAEVPGASTQTESLDGARFLRMFKIAEGPHRAVTISQAHRGNDDFHFTTTYVP